MGGIVSTLAFPVPDREYSADLLRRQGNRLIWLTLKDGQNKEHRVPAYHMQRSLRSPMTILYSHGNAEDVGISIPYLEQLSRKLQVSVLAYEYPGYSISSSKKPSEELCCLAIRAAYNYLTEDCRLDPASIVLLGRSLGTGPTVDLASQLKKEHGPDAIAGVILQSPLESGIRCVVGPCTSLTLYPLDIFVNHAKIHTVACPVLIVHGTDDRVVPCAHGRALYAALQGRPHHVDYPPRWLPGRGHNDMPEQYCLAQCRAFVDWLQVEQNT